jgi:hypothetical protein
LTYRNGIEALLSSSSLARIACWLGRKPEMTITTVRAGGESMGDPVSKIRTRRAAPIEDVTDEDRL